MRQKSKRGRGEGGGERTESLAVTTPGGVELDQGKLVVGEDVIKVVLCSDDDAFLDIIPSNSGGGSHKGNRKHSDQLHSDLSSSSVGQWLRRGRMDGCRNKREKQGRNVSFVFGGNCCGVVAVVDKAD